MVAAVAVALAYLWQRQTDVHVQLRQTIKAPCSTVFDFYWDMRNHIRLQNFLQEVRIVTETSTSEPFEAMESVPVLPGLFNLTMRLNGTMTVLNQTNDVRVMHIHATGWHVEVHADVHFQETGDQQSCLVMPMLTFRCPSLVAWFTYRQGKAAHTHMLHSMAEILEARQ